MNLEEKYKIALFGAIRNGQVMPKLRGKAPKEYINAVSYNTMLKVLEMIDFEKMEQSYLEGENEYKNASREVNVNGKA